MNKSVYNKSYPGKLWLATLTITPLLLLLEGVLLKGERVMFIEGLKDFLSTYVIFILFGLLYSIPLGIIVLVLYFTLIKRQVSVIRIKSIVIGTVLLGLFVTFYLLDNKNLWKFNWFYCYTTIVSGLLLRVEKKVQ
ncbi:MAG: hypothetical protein V4613_00265 [Bacteroidota bacterium]